ncbi:MAG: right-handed parallel beta-helix repeat-containing protein, partial [Coraliomargarita sp.]
EFYRMGQTGVMGRYPVHWHLLTNQAQGQYVRNSSIHHSFSRAVTIHGTDYLTVEDNFCYDHIGHGIFLEDGAERFNVIRNNVVLLTRRPEPGDELTPSDNSHDEVQNRTPASFWITNPNNTFEDNIAAGTEGTGYWLIFPPIPLQPSQSLAYYAGARPSREPLGKFDRNTAHSCMSGMDNNDQLKQDHSIFTNQPWDHNGPHRLNDCAWFSNNVAIYAGIGARKENIIYENNTFSDNEIAIFLATYQIVKESMLIADSGHGNLLGRDTNMYRVYDGAGQMVDNHMVGWDAQNATLLLNSGAATKHLNHRFSGFTWDHEGTPRNVHRTYDLIPQGYQETGAHGNPRVWGQVIYDLDGSVGGIPGGAIITNHPFMLVGNETMPDNWENNLVSPNRFAQMRTSYGNVKLSVLRTKPGTKTAGVYYVYGYIEQHHQLPFIVNDELLYTYYFEELPSNKRVDFTFDDTEVGDAVLLRLKNFGQLTGLAVSAGTSHTSLTSLENSQSTGYYLETGGDLYIRPVSTKRYSNTFRVQWTSAPSWPTLDSDLDGNSDQAEAIAGTDAFGFPEFANDNSEFTQAADFNGWTANADVSDFEVADGALQGRIIDVAPQLYKSDFSFNGNSALQVRVRYKNSSNGTVNFFWGSSVSNHFSAVRQLSASYTGAGAWQELVFDLGREPEWLDHTITRLRIDPNGGSGDFEIDYIRGAGPGETDYSIWASGWYGGYLSDPWSDWNGNGLSNQAERLWGMDPFVAGRNSAIIEPLDPGSGVFTYTRRDVGLSDANYSVWVSTDLTTWTEDTAAVQSRVSLNNDIETMSVRLSSDWINHEALFIQVRAVE